MRPNPHIRFVTTRGEIMRRLTMFLYFMATRRPSRVDAEPNACDACCILLRSTRTGSRFATVARSLIYRLPGGPVFRLVFYAFICCAYEKTKPKQ